MGTFSARKVEGERREGERELELRHDLAGSEKRVTVYRKLTSMNSSDPSAMRSVQRFFSCQSSSNDSSKTFKEQKRHPTQFDFFYSAGAQILIVLLCTIINSGAHPRVGMFVGRIMNRRGTSPRCALCAPAAALDR